MPDIGPNRGSAVPNLVCRFEVYASENILQEVISALLSGGQLICARARQLRARHPLPTQQPNQDDVSHANSAPRCVLGV